MAELMQDIWEVAGGDLVSQRVLNVFNDCMRKDLATVLLLETEATAQIAAGEELSIVVPTDMLKLISLKANGELIKQIALDDDNAKGYKIFGRAFEFQGLEAPVEITASYHRYPAKLTNIQSEPDIPEQYHGMLKDYYLARHFQDEGNAAVSREYWSAYYAGKEEIRRQAQERQGSKIPKKIRRH